MKSLKALDAGAHNVRPVTLRSAHVDTPPPGFAEAYQLTLSRKIPLDFLVASQESDTLLVSLHGATNREKYVLPRFEWLNTLLGTEHSSLYFSDPTLLLREDLQLSWYTGWATLDLNPIMAHIVRDVAVSLGVNNVVILGSSGGGYAALQLATYIPNSIAYAMNAQTQISKYTVNGSLGVQRRYIDVVMPHLDSPHGIPLEDRSDDWSTPMACRLSAVARYSTPVPNYAYILQNVNDVHHYEEHFLPLCEAVPNSGNVDRCRFVPYDGPNNHNPPTRDVMLTHLHNAITWRPAEASFIQPPPMTEESLL